MIHELKGPTGEIISEEEGIKNLIINHYEKVFHRSRDPCELDWNVHLNHIQETVSADSKQRLLEPFSILEIKEAVFQMEPSKAPGLDGFSALFYQKFWNILGIEVAQQVLRNLNSGQLDEGINDTLITLIPKTAGATSLDEFRPISLCYVVSKIISKVLANR